MTRTKMRSLVATMRVLAAVHEGDRPRPNVSVDALLAARPGDSAPRWSERRERYGSADRRVRAPQPGPRG